MSINYGPAFRANGTIAPCRAVVLDTTGDFLVVQAVAGSISIGIAQEGMKGPPGFLGSDTTIAAQQGDPIQVIGPGNVALAETGALVTRGDRLEADANGRLITSSGVGSGQHNVVAFALASSSGLGVKIPVLVQPHQITL